MRNTLNYFAQCGATEIQSIWPTAPWQLHAEMRNVERGIGELGNGQWGTRNGKCEEFQREMPAMKATPNRN